MSTAFIAVAAFVFCFVLHFRSFFATPAVLLGINATGDIHITSRCLSIRQKWVQKSNRFGSVSSIQ